MNPRKEPLAPLLERRSACPLCGAGVSLWRLLCDFGAMKIFACGTCRMIFMNPFLGKEGMKEFFSQSAVEAKEIPHFKRHDVAAIAQNPGDKLYRRYAACLRRIEELTGKGRLLDVGCGEGLFLYVAAKEGWKAEGIDFSSSDLERARKNLGLEAREGDFEKADFPESNFNLITLWDVLEHAADPHAVIEKCRKLLIPGGVALIACPNEGSFLTIIAGWLYSLSFGIIKFPSRLLHVIDHPLYFDKDTLKKLLREHGFEPFYLETYETDDRNINLPLFVKVFIKVLNILAKPFDMQNRIMVIAKKPC
ncbi:MAG: class I SAM-dependent methyltransferase [Candidatus Omnitrophica bacterium]|nr:class I SAM-dependent methyltransferase [Candidatus Omnitrophota bacterium]